ncbi:MAG: Ig-like domain-containing domain [Janthinobacterium lividum]
MSFPTYLPYQPKNSIRRVGEGLLLLALGSCAAVSSPQGGPLDKTPPRLVATSPDSAARNVKQQFIRLTFSEPVQVKDIAKQLLITPQLPANNPYTLRQDRNTVTLQFRQPLDPNTTYSFNFRKAIVDVTESLPAKYQALSFSTGARLDSGQVRGTVVNLLTSRPAADVVVGLYRPADTVTVRKGPPYYLTRTDNKGAFQLNFLRVAPYRLYAWSDKNGNGRFDDGEPIAYLPAPVAITDTTAPRTLQLVRPDRLPPQRTGSEANATQQRYRFNEGLAAATLTPLPPDNPAPAADVQQATQAAEQGRLLILYKTSTVGDGRYLLATTDSTGNSRRDTVNVRFSVPTTTARKTTPTGTTVEGNPRSVYNQGQVKFRFPVPVQLTAGKPVGTLTEDSLKVRPLRVPTDAVLSLDRTQLTLTLDTKAQKYVDIRLDSTVLTTVTGQSLRLRRPLRLAITPQEPTGSIPGTIKTKYAHFELQLLNEQFQVVDRLNTPKGTFLFAHLAPGKYRLRVLIDADGDGRWRSGDPNLEQPAEPVYLDPNVKDVRAGFEIEAPLSF